ncbi:gamma carbonic anhydrase family protein [Tsukamurella serpentis]
MIARFGQLTPTIAESAWVAGSATVIGDVHLAEGVGVFYSAVVRGDMASIRVGRDSNVQDGVVMHADPGVPLTVGERVSIGHNAVLHGCTVGNDVLVGMGATVLNGAVIGEGSLIAANALVPQGMQVPPGSMVAGVPAKARRDLSDAERTAISTNAAAYCELTTAHATQTGVL